MDPPTTLPGLQWVVIYAMVGLFVTVVPTLFWLLVKCLKSQAAMAKEYGDRVAAMNREYVEIANALQATLKELRIVIETRNSRFDRIDNRLDDIARRSGAV